MSLVIIWFLGTVDLVQAEECSVQDYDSTEEPDFDCPSPGEGILAPDLSPPEAIAVHEGETVTAQWDGALVPRDRLIQLGARLQAVRRLRWLDRLRVRAEYEVELGYIDEVASARQNLLDAEVRHYREEMVANERRAESAQQWYRSVWFGLIMGFVAAGVLVGLTAYLVSSL